MQLGEMIANVLAAVFLACVIAIVFFLAGMPLWPPHEARMVILLPPDATASVRVRGPIHPPLPQSFDVRIAQPRPASR